MPVHLAPILLLAGVGLAAAAKNRSKLKRTVAGTSGEFVVNIMFPDERQAEFAYGLMREIPGGPMQAGAVTIDVKEQYYAVGSVEILGTFAAATKMSEAFAYVRISELIKEVLHKVSDDSCFTVELFEVKSLSSMSHWDRELVNSCSQMLEDFGADQERFRKVAKELMSRLQAISQRGYVIDQDLIDITLELLNREIPGCQFYNSVESGMFQGMSYGLLAGGGSGSVSENAYGTFSMLILYGYEFLEMKDIPVGFNYTLPSTIPDFVKLKMDQFKPYDEIV